MDNFYRELARCLKIKHFTDCVATVKLNGKGIPKEINEEKLK